MATARSLKHDLKYDFLTLPPGKTVVQAYPELLLLPEVEKHGQAENDKWLRYAMLLTDKGSALLRQDDIEQRHRQALSIAGIDATDERAPGALDYTDEGVAEMSHALLRDSDNLMLAFVLGGEAMLWEDIRNMRTPIRTVREESAAPDGETEAQKKQRQNREGWAAMQETAEKIQRANAIRGTLFDAIPARIQTLGAIKKELFSGDKLVEKGVAAVVRRGGGIVEQMVRGNGND